MTFFFCPTLTLVCFDFFSVLFSLFFCLSWRHFLSLPNCWSDQLTCFFRFVGSLSLHVISFEQTVKAKEGGNEMSTSPVPFVRKASQQQEQTTKKKPKTKGSRPKDKKDRKEAWLKMKKKKHQPPVQKGSGLLLPNLRRYSVLLLKTPQLRTFLVLLEVEPL